MTKFLVILLTGTLFTVNAQVKIEGLELLIEEGVGLKITQNLTVKNEAILKGGGSVYLKGELTDANASELLHEITLNFCGVVPQNLNSQLGLSVSHLKVSNISNVTFNNSVGVSSFFEFSEGLLLMNNNTTLHLDKNCLVQGAGLNNYVVGSVSKVQDELTSFIYPVGDLVGGFAPVEILNGNLINDFSVKYSFTTPSNSQNLSSDITAISDAEFWNIDASELVDYGVGLRFFWNNTNALTGNLSLLTAAKYHNGQWKGLVNEQTLGNSAAGSVLVMGQTVLGDYTFVHSTGLIIDFDNESFFELHADRNQSPVHFAKHLTFKSRDFYNVGEALPMSYKIYNTNGDVVYNNADEIIVINQIEGEYAIPCVNDKLATGEYYLEVKNAKGLYSYLNFKLSGTTPCD